MIKYFRCKETEELFRYRSSKRFPVDIQRRALRKLLVLDAAVSLNDLCSPPGNHLELLNGERNNQYSIKINDQWRICFEWCDGYKYNVEIVDYH